MKLRLYLVGVVHGDGMSGNNGQSPINPIRTVATIFNMRIVPVAIRLEPEG